MKKTYISFLLLFFCFSIFFQNITFAQETDIPQQTIQKEKPLIAKKIVLSSEDVSNIQKIQINWKRGEVTISKSPDQNVYITEKASVMPKETEQVGVFIKNDVLSITDYTIIPYLPNTDDPKIQQQYEDTTYNLEVLLPQKEYKEFYFSSSEANCILQHHMFENIIAETSSGNISLSNINSHDIFVNTLYGNIMLHENIISKKYQLHTTQGSIEAKFSFLPENFSAVTQKGNITLTLPENNGFSFLQKNINSYYLQSSFSLKNKNGEKVYKNGGVPLHIICKNGTLTIKKSENPSSV